jgi:TPR repeat protein
MRQTAAAFTVLVLLCHPCPSWSQGSTATLIAICDQAAASALDQSQPTGVAGVALEKIDPKIAIPACDAAAKAAPNDPRVAFQLGRAYLVAKAYESARAHFKFAADQGNAGGQNGLGVLYANGRGGLTKDDGEAARLYKLAADQGSADGQVNLGSFYRDGRGGLTKDDGEAARLYRLAADQGSAAGQVKVCGGNCIWTRMCGLPVSAFSHSGHADHSPSAANGDVAVALIFLAFRADGQALRK